MIEITGQYYPAGSSRVELLEVQVDETGQVFVREPEEIGFRLLCSFEQLNISSRMGDTPRQVRFPDGSLLESPDNDALDQLVEQFQKGFLKGLAHRIESRMRYVVASAVAMVAFVAFLFLVVIPAASEHVARTLPASVAASVGEGSLEILDQFMFESTNLLADDRIRLSTAFNEMVADLDEPYDFKLVFRDSGDIGPNAFALPDGTIVVTDALVELAENDEQIHAVIAHEIGHVIHRHGLRRVIQSTGLSVMMVVVTGDVVSAANLAAAVPAILLESSYSRDMETEADQYALSYLKVHGPAPHNFADIMTRLDEWQSERIEDDSGIPDFLSSHPATEERIQSFLTEP